MLKWKIFKNATDYVIVRANTFNEALKKARQRDPEYCGGYVVDDDED